jgi:hypothetical protein
MSERRLRGGAVQVRYSRLDVPPVTNPERDGSIEAFPGNDTAVVHGNDGLFMLMHVPVGAGAGLIEESRAGQSIQLRRLDVIGAPDGRVLLPQVDDPGHLSERDARGPGRNQTVQPSAGAEPVWRVSVS